MHIKLILTHREMRESLVEYSGRGLPLTMTISSDGSSCSISYKCKPHISSYLSWNALTKKSSNIGPCTF